MVINEKLILTNTFSSVFLAHFFLVHSFRWVLKSFSVSNNISVKNCHLTCRDLVKECNNNIVSWKSLLLPDGDKKNRNFNSTINMDFFVILVYSFHFVSSSQLFRYILFCVWVYVSSVSVSGLRYVCVEMHRIRHTNHKV